MSICMSEHIEGLRLFRPKTRDQLARYVRYFLKIKTPDRRVCPGHASPMDYLWHSYNADFSAACGADCIVWANRGGGKTQLAAVATLLEGLFKPHCHTGLLAGSHDQAHRMYGYLEAFATLGFERFIAGKMKADACRFVNGAQVEVLPQSAAAVRGRHIHKLRCDEIELFDPDIFNAAKFVTRSDKGLCGAIEIFSTMHRPYGLMQRLIDNAAITETPTFCWCVWEVIEKCPPERSCSRCALWTDCGGKARQADGFLAIDDCIRQMRRSSRAGFEAEMLCVRPHLDNAVFAEFDPSWHVTEASYRTDLPLYRAMDFGFVNPFVCLWIQTDSDGRVVVIDEYIQRGKTVAENAAAVRRRTPCVESAVTGTFCDPAGSGRSDLTGSSAVRELAACGINVTYRKSAILDGIEKIRAALCRGDGQRRLIISPTCRSLIAALRCYHYPDLGTSELPVKDGIHDHPIDALRYFFVNYLTSQARVQKGY